MLKVHVFQFQFVVERAKSAKGYVALDDVEFKTFEFCEFTPPNAKPGASTIPPTTQTTPKPPTTVPPTTTKAPTTLPPTTTIEPTEPPDCM